MSRSTRKPKAHFARSRFATVASAASLAVVCLLMAGGVSAVEVPQRSGLGEKIFRHSELDINAIYRLPGELDKSEGASLAASDLVSLGVPQDRARLDVRGGRWAALTLGRPLMPGSGVGNALTWKGLGMTLPQGAQQLRDASDAAFRAYLQANAVALRIDPDELAASGVTTVHEDGAIVQFYVPRVFDGLRVQGSYVNAVANHGNLVLFGAQSWGDIKLSTASRLDASQALAAVQAHVAPFVVAEQWRKPELIIVPTARGLASRQIRLGQGYGHRLAWIVRPGFIGEMGRWEALVDARSGELLSFDDTNQYADVAGGVFPVSNDGVPPDGVEQASWPMPFQDTTLGTTDTGGNVVGTGSFTATFFGPYVNINDNCGAESLTQSDTIDWGTSLGTDCTTPGFGGLGNTHASRTGFYELNRIIETGRSHLPANAWLQARLTSNMNINNTCNAFWNGATVNFYRSGGGCANTGELAGVFDHEWGHGMDDNDANPSISSPSGEGIADIYTALRLNTSCIGRNFRPGVNCTGFGDACLNCTGVRDIDYLQRVSGNPHTYTWANANCGGSVHCLGAVYAEAVWSLWKRKLQSAPYSYDNNTSNEITTRLTYIGGGAVGTWFAGSPPNGGCGASGGYLNYLAADDDNGNLNDGTPHMQAIFDAFDDQEIACATPTVQDAGCAGAPPTAPVVVGTPQDKAVGLVWGAVAGATTYDVFRAEGISACDFGKVKIGTTAGTVFNDTGLQNGRDYSYVVVPKAGGACFGPASACVTVTPAGGPNMVVNEGSALLAPTSGDGDPNLDNCETADMIFSVQNTGIGDLTNPRIVGVTPSNPGVTITTLFPAPIFPPTIHPGDGGLAQFELIGGGLTTGETLTLQVEVTADELAGSSRFGDLVVSSTETDLTAHPSVTYTFEVDAEGWTTVQGTFGRSSVGGGAGGTTWYEQSSTLLDDQCDQIQSPVFVPSATTTLTLSNNFEIEPIFGGTTWYDRANVGVVDVATSSRTPVSPDGGRLYNASGANGNCGTTGQPGWADAATTWAPSSWSAGALGSVGIAGQDAQLDIRYGTDFIINGYGFRFDEVTLTDVSLYGPDAQPDVCVECVINTDCDNGMFCDGAEVCNAGTCEAGTPPVCDDAVGCTFDSCNEGTDSCDNTPMNALCDNGLFCDGAETCDVLLDCQPGTPPCAGGACDEAADICLDCDQSLALPMGVAGGGGWEQISLPCDPGAADTVADVCGDDLGGVYGTDWIMYSRDEELSTYVALTPTDSLNVGEGYWIKTLLPGQTVSMQGLDNTPANHFLTGAPVPPGSGVGCGGSAGVCNLVGHNSDFDVCWADALVIDGLANTLDQADPAGVCQTTGGPTCLMSRIAHKWTGGSFAPFDGQTPGMEGTLTPWDGFWVSSNKVAISLLIPATPGSCGPPAAQFGGAQGWYTRLIVESGSLVDRSNVLGQLIDSSDGYDSHDLAELPPFGTSYLTLVFPHSEWGEQAGDYSSDFRALGDSRTQTYPFQVRSSDESAKVVLRWEGSKSDLERAMLLDVESGRELTPTSDGSYSFEMTGPTRDFVWVMR